VVAAATLLGILTGANAVTAGFIYLVAVLGLAVWQGFIAGNRDHDREPARLPRT